MDVPPADCSYLTIDQFSEWTTLSPATIRRRIKDGVLPIWQPGGPGTRVLLSASLLKSATELPLKTPVSPVKASPSGSSSHLPGPRLRWKKR